jgi:hypothetical protein
MVNKNIKKILFNNELKKIPNFKENLRPADLRPDLFYKITELVENR